MVARASDIAMTSAPRNAGREPAGARNEKVLYVVSSFPCWSETFIVREIHALQERGVDVRIVALRRKREAFVQEDARQLLDQVIYPPHPIQALRSVLSLCVRRPISTMSWPLHIAAKLWKTPYEMAKSLVAWFHTIGMLGTVEHWDPDHIHAHWATYPSTAAMMFSRYTNVPFSFTAHAHDIYLHDHLMQEKLRCASFVATISEFNRELLERRYPAARRARIEVVHCGVPRRVRPLVRERRTEPPLIVSVGRMDEVKGFPTLLKACRELKDGSVRFRCLIVGDGPLKERVMALIESLDLREHVEMTGALPSTEVEARLSEADVFALASQPARSGNMDGIPVALMEAMASGTPVVSTRVSGIPELVEDGRTGRLVPPGDPKALAAALHEMLEDETLRARCIEGAIRKVRHEFDAKREGARLHQIISSLKGERNAEAIADHNG